MQIFFTLGVSQTSCLPLSIWTFGTLVSLVLKTLSCSFKSMVLSRPVWTAIRLQMICPSSVSIRTFSCHKTITYTLGATPLTWILTIDTIKIRELLYFRCLNFQASLTILVQLKRQFIILFCLAKQWQNYMLPQQQQKIRHLKYRSVKIILTSSCIQTKSCRNLLCSSGTAFARSVKKLEPTAN